MAENKIINLLKKLSELAKRGVGGEQENAERMLHDLCKKHGISLDDIEGEKVSEYEFHVPKEQSKFFCQVVSSVLGNDIDVMYATVDRKKVVQRKYVKCSDAEYVEIQAKWEFYWKKYNDDLEIFYAAFVQKNKLYIKKLDDDDDDTEPTLEERQRLFRMRQMMDGLDRHSFHKQITQ